MEDARDSLADFESSIFDVSDGHKLVDFIRKKKGLRAQPLQIFDDVQTNRQSLQIEIRRLDENEKTIQPEEPEAVSNEVANHSVQNYPPPTDPTKSFAVKLRKLHSIGRRTLLKEFERTLQESRFLPPTCSTPLCERPPNLPTVPISTTKETSKCRESSTTAKKSLNNAQLGCTPITVSESDTSPAEIHHKNCSARNETVTPSNNTEDVMRDLQQQNDLLLQLANSDEHIVSAQENSPEQQGSPINSPTRLPINLNRTSTPHKVEQRRTYTVHRDISSGNLILSPLKPREPVLAQTPEKSVHRSGKKLVVTPKQKQVLLSRFGRNSSTSISHRDVASAQKASRIPVIMTGSTTSKRSVHEEAVHNALENRETAQIVEQLRESAPLSAPVIVIPVNQTFNQAPNDTSHIAAKTPIYLNSPGSTEITSTTTTAASPLRPTVIPVSLENEPMPLNNLRLEDVITEDDSNSSDDRPLKKSVKEITETFNPPRKQSIQKSQKRKLSLRAAQPRNSNHHVREILGSQQLSQLSMDEILDLRKRNSQGELRKSLQMTQRDATMLDKQLELELLRRSIQEKNYEDEVLQMEVLPPPPDDFCDRRISSQLPNAFIEGPAANDDLVDETSSDRISLSQNQRQRLSTANTTQKPRRKKKKMSEQLEKYLEANQRLSTSRYLNLSKRKLYDKGHSDEAPSSDDSSPDKSHTYRKQRLTKKMSRSRAEPVDSIPCLTNQSEKTSISSGSSPSSSLPATTNLTASKPQEKIPFIQTQNNEVFKKPIGRPKKNKINPKPAPAPSTTFCAPASVDPASMDNSTTLRRSARGRKPLKAFWSCTQKEYRPLYDIHAIEAAKWEKQKSKASIQRAKRLPSRDDHLVANTKTSRSGSVEKKTGSKTSEKKLQENEPKQAKRKGKTLKEPSDYITTECPPDEAESHSSRLEDLSTVHSNSKTRQKITKGISATPSECSSEDSGDVRSNTKLRNKVTKDISATPSEYSSEDSNQSRSHSKSRKKVTKAISTAPSECSSEDSNQSRSHSKSRKKVTKAINTAPSECLSNDSSNVRSNSKSRKKVTKATSNAPSESSSKDSSHVRSNSKSRKKVTKNTSTAPSEFPSEDLPYQSSPREENTELDNCYTSKISVGTEPSTSKASGRKSKKGQSFADTHAIDNSSNTTSKYTGDTEKPDTSNATSSVWSSKDYSSSVQPIRLATIAEDSIPETNQFTTVQTSFELMPPPSTNSVGKKSKKYKKTKKDAFRKEHDESIADVSSAHVNRLFDQLKSSSMCVPIDDKEQENCSVQVSLDSGVNGSAVRPKCKSLKVRLARLKTMEQSLEGNEKVCDSGFSSEDMSSGPKHRGDILFNWLKELLKSGKNPSCPQNGVARVFQSDGFHVASVDDLTFEQIDGVEYAFYKTKQKCSFGYIRFMPKTEKKKSLAKKFELCFFVLCGKLTISINHNSVHCKNGDLITVFKGTRYGLENTSNDPALVMVIKK